MDAPVGKIGAMSSEAVVHNPSTKGLKQGVVHRARRIAEPLAPVLSIYAWIMPSFLHVPSFLFVACEAGEPGKEDTKEKSGVPV